MLSVLELCYSCYQKSPVSQEYVLHLFLLDGTAARIGINCSSYAWGSESTELTELAITGTKKAVAPLRVSYLHLLHEMISAVAKGR